MLVGLARMAALGPIFSKVCFAPSNARITAENPPLMSAAAGLLVATSPPGRFAPTPLMGSRSILGPAGVACLSADGCIDARSFNPSKRRFRTTNSTVLQINLAFFCIHRSDDMA